MEDPLEALGLEILVEWGGVSEKYQGGANGVSQGDGELGFGIHL